MSTLHPSEVTIANPLQRYFRAPALNVTLPSKGLFFTPGSVTFNEDGTLPVYPMRAADEYLLKTPDALLSGLAVEKLIESCIPAISRPKEVSTCDLDAILLAIRAATYGEKMDVDAVCPKCGEENSFECDLPGVLATMTYDDEETCVRLDETLIAYVRPYNFANATRVSMATFEETRKVQALEQDEAASEEAKKAQLATSMDRITSLTSSLIANCVIKVVTPEGEVTNPVFIKEFMGEITKAWHGKIEKRIDRFNTIGIDKTVEAHCGKCGHDWKTHIEFDPATFFA